MDKKQILIVDDKESIAKILSVYLGYEYEIVFYDNPIKALAWLQDGNMPDLIVSDIRMPEMRGDEFLMLLKQDELFRQIPVSCSRARTAPPSASACSNRAPTTTSSNRSIRWSSNYA